MVVLTLGVCQLAVWAPLPSVLEPVLFALLIVDVVFRLSPRLIVWYLSRCDTARPDASGRSLYLRSFPVDETVVGAEENFYTVSTEDRILRHMARIAPPVKVVNDQLTMGYGDIGAFPLTEAPGGPTRNLGAEDPPWLPEVQTYAEQAELVLVCPTNTVGVLYELRMLGRVGLTSKTLLVFPPPTAKFVTDWNEMLCRLRQHPQLEPLLELTRDTNPEQFAACFIGADGRSVRIPRSEGVSLLGRLATMWTWDADVRAAMTAYIDEHERVDRLPPAKYPAVLELLAIVLVSLAALSLREPRIASSVVEATTTFGLSTCFAAMALLLQVGVGRERNWRLRAALFDPRFNILFVIHTLHVTIAVLALS